MLRLVVEAEAGEDAGRARPRALGRDGVKPGVNLAAAVGVR
jgi:hypothetical protein